jgi:hypothetical protein
VNAFVQGIRETPTDLVTMVHLMTRHLPPGAHALQQDAAAGHVARSNDRNVHRLPPSFFASSCFDLPPASKKGKRQRSLAKKPFLLLRAYASVHQSRWR